MSVAATGRSCQLRSRNSFKPWKSPASTRIFFVPVSRRYFEPVTVRAAPRNVRVNGTAHPLSGSGEETGLTPGMPEQHGVRGRERPRPDSGDQAGHGLGGIGVIEKESLSPQRELQ